MSRATTTAPDRHERAARPDPGPARPAAAVPTVSRRRRLFRGVLLLLALLWVPASVVLAVLHVLLWVSVPLAAVTLVAVLVWLRLEVRVDRAGARSATVAPTRSAPGSGRSRRGRAPSTVDTQVIHTAVGDAAGSAVARPSTAGLSVADRPVDPTPAPVTDDRPAAAAGPARSAGGSAAYDIEAELARDAARAPAPQPAAEGTWRPVPVPRPTYTLKAKAEPRMTADGVPADVFATPEFAEEADELDARGHVTRRAASL